jgi:hypothetical protein
MLRITVEQKADKVILHLEGKLAGPWVHELRSLWIHLEPLRNERMMVADLLRTTYLDVAGRNLLSEMYHQGVEFQAAGPLIAHIVEEIRNGAPYSPRIAAICEKKSLRNEYHNSSTLPKLRGKEHSALRSITPRSNTPAK